MTDIHPIRAILNDCANIVDQRGEPYGGIEDSFADAATIASILTGKDVSARDVALVLHSVKLVRLAGNPTHGDSYDDGINYLAFAKLLTPKPSDRGEEYVLEYGAKCVEPQKVEVTETKIDAPEVAVVTDRDGKPITDWSQFDNSVTGAAAMAKAKDPA